METKTTIVEQLLSKCTNKGGCTLHSYICGLILQTLPCFLLTPPRSGCSTGMTSLHRSGPVPHLFKQREAKRSKSRETKGLLTSTEISLLFLLFLKELSDGKSQWSAQRAEMVPVQPQRSVEVQVDVQSRCSLQLCTPAVPFCECSCFGSTAGCGHFQTTPRQNTAIKMRTSL